MDCSTWGFHVLYHLPEFAHAHVHRVGNDVIESVLGDKISCVIVKMPQSKMSPQKKKKKKKHLFPVILIKY